MAGTKSRLQHHNLSSFCWQDLQIFATINKWQTDAFGILEAIRQRCRLTEVTLLLGKVDT